jgi:hypothetical protein
MPHLQRKSNFENAISRLARELPLNSKFVKCIPKSPALCCKENPYKALGFSIK